MTAKKKILVGSIAGTVVLLVGLGVFAFRNYYSVVADIRESMMDIDTADPYTHGKTLFQTRGCVFCHTLEDAGSTAEVGPNLTGIGRRVDDAYLRESIVNPNAVIATACPEGPCEANAMPNFGNVLDEEQVTALVTYLSEQE
ncbi:MAG: c-type cytochrome [Aggregatilineales bacterium]